MIVRAIPLMLAIVSFAFYVYAVCRQPKRLKARLGFAASILWLLLGTAVFFWWRSDEIVRLLLFPLAIFAPLLSFNAIYRLYTRWSPKYWDPADPEFLGWTQR
jgi:EamA domain-containing membrane protein RarD